MVCDRCKDKTLGVTMSRFNTDMICRDCEEKEKAHPDYGEAVWMEAQAVKHGDMNFPGIGKPADL